MNKIVFTQKFCSPENLFPFTLTRKMQDIRLGILTIREKWERLLQMPSFDLAEEDYKDKDDFMVIDEAIGNDVIYLLHANILPTPRLVKAIKKLKRGEFLALPEKENIAYCISKKQVANQHAIKVKKAVELDEELQVINYPWDIVKWNAEGIRQDFELLIKTNKRQSLSSSNRYINKKNIFIERGASVEHCILNAKDGPIYIASNATVMEGSLLRGPLSIGENATVKMGTKIYGATTIGPGCIVGGEIKNSILMGYSNKAHDGYLGDSVIGEWCNLGAGTSNSNVKNNASDIMVYTPSGLKNAGWKCGVMMGDYSRTAINTSINTGTVIGICCNVFGGGLTPKFIPSFSWGSDGIQRYQWDKALVHLQNWKAFKNQKLEDKETSILHHIFENY